MSKITFITGNAHKAAYVAQALGVLIDYHKLDLDEIQSLDLHKVVEHKARQAYEIVQAPVLVEDVALECHALGRLPGTFIKWFIEEIGNEGIAAILNDDRRATARICYALYDGRDMQFFDGAMTGSIATSPRGANGFGWDHIFIKDGQKQTRAELDDATEKATSMRREPLEKLKIHIGNNNL